MEASLLMKACGMTPYSDDKINIEAAKNLYGTFWRVDFETPSSEKNPLLRVVLRECLGVAMDDYGFSTKQEARSYAEVEYSYIMAEKQAFVSVFTKANGEKTKERIEREIGLERLWKSQPSTPVIEESCLPQYFDDNRRHDDIDNQMHVAKLPFSAQTKDIFLLFTGNSGRSGLAHHRLKGFEITYAMYGTAFCACLLDFNKTDNVVATLELFEGGTYAYRQVTPNQSDLNMRGPGIKVNPDCVFTSFEQVAEYAAALKSRASEIEEELHFAQSAAAMRNDGNYSP